MISSNFLTDLLLKKSDIPEFSFFFSLQISSHLLFSTTNENRKEEEERKENRKKKNLSSVFFSQRIFLCIEYLLR